MQHLFNLEKWVQSENDFEHMNWRLCQMRAISFLPKSNEIAFDVDYIFKAIIPTAPGNYYKFWLAPATLIFWNVHDIVFEIDSLQGNLEIEAIVRKHVGKPVNAEHISRNVEWQFDIELINSGQVSLLSAGFFLYARREPKLTTSAFIDLEERGGISFFRGRED